MCASSNTHHLAPGSLVMVRSTDLPCLEWPLGKVFWIFLDNCGVISTVEVQVGSDAYVLPQEYVVPFELSREEAQTFHSEKHHEGHFGARTQQQ